ncbi:MAG: FprA family A-type flavoprotein [Fervidobacterium sp.]|nr:FprA family A-type flavoprotein [Fervidobacterium sp.]
MEVVAKIVDGVYYVGVNDRDTHLFENIWPLTKGVSYNSYLVVDEKTALIDTVKVSKMGEYIEKIHQILDGKKLDYLIINHMEPDHSGAISSIVHAFPGVKVVGNKRTHDFIKAMYHIDVNFYEVREGDEIDLGNRKLKFFLTPMVHWPETMMTYEINDKILFAGDAFGGFGSLDGGIFDDEVDVDYFENEIRRYYSNIVGKFGPMVQKALQKFNGVEIKIVCSTHGPVWRTNPMHIISAYDRWSKYEYEEGVVIAYGTMYGNTEKMADYVARVLAEEGVKNIRVMNTSTTHESFIINEIWRFKGIILGTCTYNNGIFPPMENLIINLSHKGLPNRVFSVFGTYGWSGGGVKGIVDYIERNKWQMVGDPVEVNFSPREEDFGRLRNLAVEMAKAVKSE